MLAAVVFVPSAPLLVPELAGPSATDTEPVRSAAVSAVRRVAPTVHEWVAIGAGDDPGSGAMVGADRGSFRPWGVDVRVALVAESAPAPDRTAPDRTSADLLGADAGAPPRMCLSMLIAAWLRGQAGVAEMTPLVLGPCTGATQAVDLGRDLATRLAATAEPTGVLVVGDGATALTPKAPGGGRRESAVALQARIDDALGTADLAALTGLSAAECRAEGVGGRVAWQVAAGLAAGTAWEATLDHAAAPFGVGYVVARWTPVPSTTHGAAR